MTMQKTCISLEQKSSSVSQTVLEKQVFSEEGYATPLGWGDILPDSDSLE